MVNSVRNLCVGYFPRVKPYMFDWLPSSEDTIWNLRFERISPPGMRPPSTSDLGADWVPSTFTPD
jgi:hypothetical protein